MPDALGERIALDWINDLAEFDEATIERAITSWRRHEKRRPTPADIRELCTLFTPKPSVEPEIPSVSARRPGELDPNIPEQRAEAESHFATIKRLLGEATKPFPGVPRRKE